MITEEPELSEAVDVPLVVNAPREKSVAGCKAVAENVPNNAACR